MKQELPDNTPPDGADQATGTVLLAVPSIHRALQDLPLPVKALVLERYRRLLPILLLFLKPRDVLERNRTWAGVSPDGKRATKLLSGNYVQSLRKPIEAYASKNGENTEQLLALLHAYCRHGPIGLLEALPTDVPSLIPDELQDCADFHRLAKHPRSDAGIYIRELLSEYADDLGYQRLPPFVARYAWATNRKIERWFFGEQTSTEHVVKTTRRLNLDQAYPHQRWLVHMAPLPLRCVLAQRHPIPVEPWIIWITDEHTSEIMGFRVCPTRPSGQDVWLTYRWSIWHYEAPWWKARGAPDELALAIGDFDLPEDIIRALRYLHCNVRPADAAPINSYVGLPKDFTTWIIDVAEMVSEKAPARALTLAQLTDRLLDYLQDTSAATSAVNPPGTIMNQGVSLPWHDGIAATLLLPSAGIHVVQEDKVWPFGVPFDVLDAHVQKGQPVDVRYDPEDARYVYLVHDGGHVERSPASAFEHRVAWIELVDNTASTVMSNQS